MIVKEKYIGIGEVRGFVFTLVEESKYGLLYEVNDEGRIYYEVFYKRLSPPKYEKYQYPTSKAFGLWAWTYVSLQEAKGRLNQVDIHKEKVAEMAIPESKLGNAA